MSVSTLPQLGRRVRFALLSPSARPLRFVGTGAIGATIQLTSLAVLIHEGWHDIPANVVAFLAAAQVTFLLSYALTWHDRRAPGTKFRAWLFYHASITVTALLNMLVFLAARQVMHSILASALGILAGAIGNYVAGNRFIFRTVRPANDARESLESVA